MSQQDSKSLSEQRYTEFAEGYVKSETHAKGADLDRLIAIAQPQSDWVVLDVATGGGHTALKFAPHVARVVASDLTPRMLEKAAAFITEQGASNVTFKQADAENLPFDDAMFDLVTCRIAPHHFPDCQKFVTESARVLKSGGLLMVQDHVLPDDEAAAKHVDDFEKLRDPSHNFAFTQAGWVGMFENAGLTVTHTEHLTKQHHFVDWAERQGCTPGTIGKLVQMLEAAPPIAAAWMQADHIGTPEATFVNHHLIIAGRKS